MHGARHTRHGLGQLAHVVVGNDASGYSGRFRKRGSGAIRTHDRGDTDVAVLGKVRQQASTDTAVRPGYRDVVGQPPILFSWIIRPRSARNATATAESILTITG